ncbi:ligand-gated channel [Salmonella enterica subsp. enterica serovar Choleraesuis]|nr:ligand-gated channel [Salmonella enterica subsp. enterica serovar Choleraesuis]
MVVSATPDAPQVASEDTPAAEKQTTLGNLGTRSITDVPWSVTSMSAPLIRNQQLKSLKDVLRYMPSVQGDGVRPQSRGMQGSVVQNSLIDGLNVVSTTEYPAEQFQQVDVVNGLAGGLYGPANPAGLFNLVSKRPTDTPLHRVTVGAGTASGPMGSLDLSGPIDSGDRVKYRLNLLDEDGHGYTHGSHVRRQYAGLGLDFQLTDKTVLETNFSWYHYYDRGLPGNIALAKGMKFPHPLNPRNDNYGEKYAGNDDHTSTAVAHLKHDFDGNWLLDLGVLRQIADRESTTVTNTLINNRGDYNAVTANSAASRFTITSYMANLTGGVDTGTIHHDLTFGFRGFSWKNFNPVAGASMPMGQGNLWHSQHLPRPDYPDFYHRYHSATTTQTSFLVSDTLTFSPQWSLLLSGSQNQLHVSNYNKASARTSTSNDHGLSGSASLMFKPVESLTLYTTWADSLQQGDTAPAGAKNAGEVINPYRSRQIEVGSKWAVTNDLVLSAALFEAKRPFAWVQENGEFSQDGKQRNRGLELMADGYATSNLRLFGGVTFLDARLHGTASPETSDKRVVGLPRVTANMLAVYTLPQLPDVDVDANVRYVGRRATDNTNQGWVGSYTTLDLGSNYRTKLFGNNTTFRLDITNVTNRHYWNNIVPGALTGYTGAGYASAQLGAPREAQLSMTMDF